MPCLEISMPSVDVETRKKLAEKLTDAFIASTNYPADIFGIRFYEYEPGDVALGGKIWENNSSQPYLHMMLFCPKLSFTIKQKLVDNLSNAFAFSVEKENWLPVIHICEHPYDNVGVKGKLLTDSYDECAKAEFYYDLPRE